MALLRELGGPLVNDLDAFLTPCARLGVPGPDGIRKTTLLRTVTASSPRHRRDRRSLERNICLGGREFSSGVTPMIEVQVQLDLRRPIGGHPREVCLCMQGLPKNRDAWLHDQRRPERCVSEAGTIDRERVTASAGGGVNATPDSGSRDHEISKRARGYLWCHGGRGDVFGIRGNRLFGEPRACYAATTLRISVVCLLLVLTRQGMAFAISDQEKMAERVVSLYWLRLSPYLTPQRSGSKGKRGLIYVR